MSLVSNYLTLSASHRSATSSNVYGEPTFGSSSTVSTRIERGQRTFRNSAGDFIIAETTIYVEPDLAVVIGDQFQIAGAWHIVEGFKVGQGLHQPAFKEVYLRRIAS